MSTDVVVSNTYADGADLCRQYEAAKRERSSYETDWKDITARVRPSMLPLFNAGGASARDTGAVDRSKARDAKAAIALERFVAMIMYMLTPEGSKWHGLEASDPSLNAKPRVKAYFDAARDVMFSYRYRPDADFAAARYGSALSLGLYGNGVTMITKPSLLYKNQPPPRGLAYRSYPLPDIFFAQNADGRVDRAFRRIVLSARQARQMFRDNEAALPTRIRQKLAKSMDIDAVEHEFFQFIAPQEEHDPEALDERRMPYAGVYVSVENKAVMKTDYFRTWPFSVATTSIGPGELYGRGPAHTSLSAIRTASDMKRTILKQGQRTVDPPLLAHDDGVVGDISLLPGAINYGAVDQQGRPLVHPMPVGRVDIGHELLTEERKDISDAFLETLWLILIERPERTATEVLELLREKGALVSPMMGVLQARDIGALVSREADLLSEQGLLPPLPPELMEAKGEYAITYTSPLAKAMAMEGVTGFMRITSFLGEVAGLTKDPRILARLNFDKATDYMAPIMSVPMSLLRTDDEMKAIDEQQKQAAQVQQISDAAPAIAGIVKATGGALQ